MIIIPVNKNHRIILADTESWTLEKWIPTKDGSGSWRFVANMRSLENLLARCAMRTIQIAPENLVTLNEIATAWAAERERFVQAVKAARVPDEETINATLVEWEALQEDRRKNKAAALTAAREAKQRRKASVNVRQEGGPGRNIRCRG